MIDISVCPWHPVDLNLKCLNCEVRLCWVHTPAEDLGSAAWAGSLEEEGEVPHCLAHTDPVWLQGLVSASVFLSLTNMPTYCTLQQALWKWLICCLQSWLSSFFKAPDKWVMWFVLLAWGKNNTKMSHWGSKLTKIMYLMCVEAHPLCCRVMSVKRLLQSLIKYCSIAVGVQVPESTFGTASEPTDRTAVSLLSPKLSSRPCKGLRYKSKQSQAQVESTEHTCSLHTSDLTSWSTPTVSGFCLVLFFPFW